MFKRALACRVNWWAMSTKICKQCKRQFQFDQFRGYSREFCGPLCDGSHNGRKYAITLVQEVIGDIHECLQAQRNPTASAAVIEVVLSRLQNVIEKLEE